jgi:two-component system chemotaxis response regulator CheY
MVLIVDDYSDICTALERLVRMVGKTSATANDAAAALAIMKGRRPSLVILDDMMPGMTGLELLQSIRDDEGLRHVPVIMYSAGDDAARRAEATRLGALAWVCKGRGFGEVVN